MTGFPGSRRLIRAGLVLISPENGSVERIITLQYAPETLSRQLQAQTVEDESNRSRPLRLTGPAKGELRADVIDHVFRYGVSGDRAVAGDWNGDGISSIGVFRDGTWRVTV